MTKTLEDDFCALMNIISDAQSHAVRAKELSEIRPEDTDKEMNELIPLTFSEVVEVLKVAQLVRIERAIRDSDG